MHIKAARVFRTEQNQLVIEIAQGQQFIATFAKAAEVEQAECSLRFAAARFGNDAYLVLGVRKQGRGFDVLIPEPMWNAFLEEIETIALRGVSDETNAETLVLGWDEEAFQAFLDQCQQRLEEDPSLEVMGKIVQFYS
jgi:hypothetical protein